MKTMSYALGALAIVISTAAFAGDGDGGKAQAEFSATQRGDHAAARSADRFGEAAPVRLERELRDGDATAERSAAPRSDRWMFQSSRTDSVYGD